VKKIGGAKVCNYGPCQCSMLWNEKYKIDIYIYSRVCFENACIKLMYILQTTRELMMDITVDECK
jgi:hypothetical protein